MGVYLPIKDYSAMQGPAPDGFHIPTKDEWQAIYDILITAFSMTKNATTMGTYLKMPRAGRRIYNDADVYTVGSNGFYWYSTPYNANTAYQLFFNSSDISYHNHISKSFGCSIRCFKNSPTIPTSSWTTLYQGSGSAGIFWNSTDGLISVSGDGATWHTIMDKNLGATVVFNQGDTETNANCGYFYQWGNNYGFPHSGSVTTSSTQVDASNYGPGNYYNSSTFITGSTNWSSVQNDNLWGATTGVKPMSELKNAYIGEYRVPGENTVAYYPLNTDFNDASGNGYNLTNNGAVIQTKAGVECAYFDGSSYATNSSAQNGTTRTLCAWVYIELSKTQDMGLICTGNTGDSFVGIGINQGKGYITDWWVHNENGTISVLNGWHLIGGVITNGGNMVLYTDGVQNASYTYSRQSGTSITLGARTGSWTEKLTGWMSRVIVENEGWTQQDFQTYYNNTKSNYGL